MIVVKGPAVQVAAVRRLAGRGHSAIIIIIIIIIIIVIIINNPYYRYYFYYHTIQVYWRGHCALPRPGITNNKLA